MNCIQNSAVVKLHPPYGAKAVMSRILRAPEEKQVFLGHLVVVHREPFARSLEESEENPVVGAPSCRGICKKASAASLPIGSTSYWTMNPTLRDIKGGREQEERSGRVRRLEDGSSSRQTAEERVPERQEKYSAGQERRNPGPCAA